MNLLDRIKKEMSEGIVRALLEDAGYRVVDTGIEKVLREITGLSQKQYIGLHLPRAMRHLPDLTVLTKDETKKYLLEVKYRDKWGVDIFDDAALKEQVKHMEEIVLVSINANPPVDKRELHGPSRYLRSCKLRKSGDDMLVETKKYLTGTLEFVKTNQLPKGDALWWSMLPLQAQFPEIKNKANEENLVKAVNAIVGILN